MKHCIIFVIITLILMGCSTDKTSIDSISKTIELNYISKNDSISGIKMQPSDISKIYPYKNGLMLLSYRDRIIYFCDNDYHLLSEHNLKKEWDYLFKMKIYDTFLAGDTLFVADGTPTIKKIDLSAKTIKTINLKMAKYQGFPFELFISANGNIVTSFKCMYNTNKNKSDDDYLWGTVYDHGGNYIKNLTFSKSVFGHDLINYDIPHYIEYDGQGYVCFVYSKVVVEIGKKDSIHTLCVNEDWVRPLRDKDRSVTGKSMNFQKMVKYKNYFLSLALPAETTKNALIIVYNTEFKPLCKLVLKGAKVKYWYYITISGEKMIVYNRTLSFDNSRYVYDLSTCLFEE